MNITLARIYRYISNFTDGVPINDSSKCTDSVPINNICVRGAAIEDGGIDSMGRDRISIRSAGSTTINDSSVSGAAIDDGGTWIKSGS